MPRPLTFTFPISCRSSFIIAGFSIAGHQETASARHTYLTSRHPDSMGINRVGRPVGRGET